jgi:hypothetical protein
MKTQAWGWLAAGVVALGVNGFYQDGGFTWAHRVADRIESRSAAVLALASGQAERFLAEARIVNAQDNAEVDRWEAMSVRQEAQAARAAAAQVRVQVAEARVACRRVPAVQIDPAVFRQIRIQACPRIHVNIPRMARMEVPAVRIPAISIPRIEVPRGNIPRVEIPRISIPRVEIPSINIPKISVPAVPEIHVDLSGEGPV